MVRLVAAGLLLALATLAIVIWWPDPPTRVAAAPRPNILFIAIDDLRPELGCYGVEAIQTPHIDALAASGVRFDRAYCQIAICAPSRISLLAGRRPDALNIYRIGDDFRGKHPDLVTLPQHFLKLGYRVEGYGKIFHRSEDDAASWHRSVPEPKTSFHQDPKTRALMHQRYRDAKERGLRGRDYHHHVAGPCFESEETADESYPDGQLAQISIKALERLKKAGKPFFLGVGFFKPHMPFACPKKYWDLYDPAALPTAAFTDWHESIPRVHFQKLWELRPYWDLPDEGRLDAETARKMVHGYYACTSYVDAQLGKLIAELDRLDLRKNTIIVLWGDHGWALGERGLFGKATNFEESTRAPLIISGPGVATGASSGFVEFVDLYPTLCEMARLPVPGHLEGDSLVPLLQRPSLPWKEGAYSQFPRSYRGNDCMGVSLRTERYRIVEWQPRPGRADGPGDPTAEPYATELYDHRNDPTESTNVAGDPAYADAVARMRRKLHAGWKAMRP